jgi:hypothetical protein
VAIGDVGVVDPRRSFDFLFNIRNTSISRIDSPCEAQISSQPAIWATDYVICSPTMERKQIDPGVSTTITKCSTDHLHHSHPARVAAGFHLRSSFDIGALLVLPEGASRQDLKNIGDYQKYALQHGLAWYQYARERGRVCPEGSLYLVTGHDKTRRWGLTSFSSTPGMHVVSVKLGLNDTSCWGYSGCVGFRLSDDKHPPVEKNQCVFLRGITISEQGSSAKKSGKRVRVEDDNRLGQKTQRSIRGRTSKTTGREGSTRRLQRSEGSGSPRGVDSESVLVNEETGVSSDNEEDEDASSDASHPESHTAST